ncbi:MAG: roadblock/LC7 domain-containing protein [Chloroflexota bacterium]
MEIPPGGHYISSGLTLLPRHEQAIDQVLSDLRGKVPANLAILVSRDGQFISASGEATRNVDLVALGSLIAGDLAASQRIAELTGIYEEHQVILREGAGGHILVSDAGSHMVLFVLAPGQVPAGWLRLLGLEAGKLLARIVAAPSGDELPKDLYLDEKSLADQFDRALGDLWQG